jgi:outer membrane protein
MSLCKPFEKKALIHGDERMHFPSLKDSVRVVAALTLIGLLPASVLGQTSSQEPAATQTVQTPVPTAPSAQKPGSGYSFTDYTKPRSHFPNLIAPYSARNVDAPNLSNTPRIDQVMQNGRIMLSLDDAIAIALENNLDIAIARFNLPIADTDILLANAGQSTRGVNTGVVQGTPGGGVNVGLSGTSTTGSQGGGAGGTTAGAGGAGTGSAGIVTSTLGVGSTVPSFDPIITGTLQVDRGNSPATNAFAGIPLINQNTSTVDFGYSQGFHSGTILSVGFNNSRVTTNSPFTTLSPTVNSNFRATLSQPILQGFGFLPNTRFIRIAKNNREISDVAFRLQVITSVNQIENIYWDLVNAYENVKVQQDSLALAQKTLGDNQKQVQIGTLAPIEVVRAQSVVATDQQALIVAQTNLELQQLLIKNALSRTLVDPQLAEAEVIPTSTMQVPANEPVVPIQDLINDALSHRAELAESRIDLTNRDLNSKSARNALLPTLSLFAYYGGTGLGGTPNPAGIPCTPTSTSFCVDPNTPRTSYGGTVGQLFDSSFPDKGAGLQLNIPLRNRAAQANQVRAELEYRQSQMRLQQLENQVRIEVRNAQFSVQQNRASVEAAQAAVELGRQSLDAEQKKYALGASTTTLVLQNQRDLAQAQSNLVAAKAAYEKARVELDRATGLTLANNGILLSDAISGQVTKLPSVPYAAPRQDVPPQVPGNQGQNGMPQPQSIQSAPPDVQSAPGVVQPSPDVQPPNPQPPQK